MSKPITEEIPSQQRLLPARAVADYYGACLRTVSRWVARGIIPAPDAVILGRRYWYRSTLQEADRRRTVEAGKAVTAAHTTP